MPPTMRPILILQHARNDGPAYFGEWLAARGLPSVVRDSSVGDEFPERIDGHAGLCVLGGPMSANDPLPSLRRAESLIRQAMSQGVPVIGHCLGGQLMARALGRRVHASPRPEIGWQALQVHDTEMARTWFGRSGPAMAFQWHYEAFELPDGAQWLASSDACAHQAFSLGPHLGMQFHIEIDAVKIAAWSSEDGARFERELAHCPTVETAARMIGRIPGEMPAHRRLADALYGRWADGLQR